MAPEKITDPTTRCRLVLCMGPADIANYNADALAEILAAGDVASLIVYSDGSDESAFQRSIESLVPVAQSAGVATIVVEDTQTAGRLGVDGLQLGQDPVALRDAIDRFSPQMMVGAGNVKTRHNALVLGELQPDYLMFGKPGGDTRPEPHPKNLALGQWWSTIVEIPCIVLGGNTIDSVIVTAQSGSDFVALGSAIFAPNEDAKNDQNLRTAAQRVQAANQLLDEHAPPFEILSE